MTPCSPERWPWRRPSRRCTGARPARPTRVKPGRHLIECSPDGKVDGLVSVRVQDLDHARGAGSFGHRTDGNDAGRCEPVSLLAASMSLTVPITNGLIRS